MTWSKVITLVVSSCVMGVCTLSTSAHAATFSGKNLTIQYIFGPSDITNFGRQRRTVGPGVEAVFFGDIAVDVNDTGFSIISRDDSPGFAEFFPFNGIRITDHTNTIDDFTNASLTATSFSTDPSLTISADSIFVNFVPSIGEAYRTGDVLAEVTVFGPATPVPLPGAAVLLGSTLLGAGAMRRVRRTQA
ncbi:MAG: VPLPA-CTERM sorting domain-containing protein [Pseudomonadota bacterium]